MNLVNVVKVDTRKKTKKHDKKRTLGFDRTLKREVAYIYK